MISTKAARQQEILKSYQETFPVRTPDAIQSHGFLIAVSLSSFAIKHISQNMLDFLDMPLEEVLGKPLSLLVADDQIRPIRSCLSEDSNSTHFYELQLFRKKKSQSFHCLIHCTKHIAIFDLESVASIPKSLPSERSFTEFYSLLTSSLARINQVADLDEFLRLVTHEVRQLTEFDRVMVYRFDQDGSGIVDAECRCPDLPAYLGLRFPFTDIPQVARNLFHDSPSRMIVDVESSPIALLSDQNSDSEDSLDLGKSILRIPSPCHLEYLTNMGVRASFVVPLIKKQQLWGLISCHHRSPKYLPYPARAAVELIAQVMNTELNSKTKQSEQTRKAELQAMRSDFVSNMMRFDDLTAAFEHPDDRLLSMVGADGAVVCLDQKLIFVGKTPKEPKIRKLLSWILPQVKDNLFYTDTLEDCPPLKNDSATASGVLFLQISRIRHYFIVWFRPELVQTVNWAGDPSLDAEINADGVLKLNPRHSFALWQETVRHCSRPWELCEIENALSLRSDLIGVVLNKFDELTRRNDELSSFAYVASHDLKAPLRAVSNLACWLQEDLGDSIPEESQELLDLMQARVYRMHDMISALLQYSRVGSQKSIIEDVNINLLLEEVVDSLAPPAGFSIVFPENPASLHAHKILIRQVFANLLSNAIKYVERPDGKIEVSVTDFGNYLQFEVKDNGPGSESTYHQKIFQIFQTLQNRDEVESTGIGLAIVKKVVEGQGGTISVDSSPGNGCSFIFTWPKA